MWADCGLQSLIRDAQCSLACPSRALGVETPLTQRFSAVCGTPAPQLQSTPRETRPPAAAVGSLGHTTDGVPRKIKTLPAWCSEWGLWHFMHDKVASQPWQTVSLGSFPPERLGLPWVPSGPTSLTVGWAGRGLGPFLAVKLGLFGDHWGFRFWFPKSVAPVLISPVARDPGATLCP